jgi:hypothetical protein
MIKWNAPLPRPIRSSVANTLPPQKVTYGFAAAEQTASRKPYGDGRD